MESILRDLDLDFCLDDLWPRDRDRDLWRRRSRDRDLRSRDRDLRSRDRDRRSLDRERRPPLRSLDLDLVRLRPPDRDLLRDRDRRLPPDLDLLRAPAGDLVLDRWRWWSSRRPRDHDFDLCLTRRAGDLVRDLTLLAGLFLLASGDFCLLSLAL